MAKETVYNVMNNVQIVKIPVIIVLLVTFKMIQIEKLQLPVTVYLDFQTSVN